MSTDSPSVADTVPLVPKDAATLVLVDSSNGVPRILMGRRHPDMAFLANKFVFPGGRVDAEDLTAFPDANLAPPVAEKLLVEMRGEASLARVRALGLAAIREVREETGLILGSLDAPPLEALWFFARAITPPGRPRRFDTRFFLADAALATSANLAGDGELSSLDWFTLEQARLLDIPNVTRLVLEDVSETLKEGRDPGRAVPFYYHQDGQFRRDLL